MTAALLLIRRLRPLGEPTMVPVGAHGAATIEGTAGAGRIVLALTEAGVACDTILQLVIPTEIDLGALRTLFDDHEFDTVVLGSHLVNLPDESRRRELLELAARSVRPAGSVIVEHHPVDWAETADDVEPTPGSSVGMENVRREPPFVSAVSVFDVGGRVAHQPFTARVLSEAELAVELAGAGLLVTGRLSPTLIQAAPRA